jgi:tetratricopeptide (TPR) repeat protein
MYVSRIMAFEAFISYSHRDKTTADATCAALEAAGVRCWIAPRDIVPGTDWGEAIIDAITGAKIMVLVFSGHTNVSPQIKREVERAVSKAIPIIPLRIEDVAMNKSFEYFLSTSHWLDALTPPVEKHLARLTDSVRALLKVPAAKSDSSEINQAAGPPPTGQARPAPTTSDAFFDRGVGYYRRHEYDRAIKDLDEAIRLNPKFLNALHTRGNTYLAKREYDRAIADYDEAIRLNPKYAGAFTNRAITFQNKGEYDRALADYDEAIRLNPKAAYALYQRSIVKRRMNDDVGAEADLEAAIRINPDVGL